MADNGCKLPGARESGPVSLGVSNASTESAPVPGSAKRLEDVEKVVRESRLELEELYQWVTDITDALCTRLEALEDGESPRVVLRRILDGPGLD